VAELDLTGTFKLGSFKLGSSAALLEVTSRAGPPGVGGHESLAVPAVRVAVRVTVPGTATGTAVAAARASGGDHATMLTVAVVRPVRASPAPGPAKSEIRLGVGRPPGRLAGP
jgi:hypothetical protein